MQNRDENEEAIARVRMLVDIERRAAEEAEDMVKDTDEGDCDDVSDDGLDGVESTSAASHCRFASPNSSWQDSKEFSATRSKTDPRYRGFDTLLRSFIATSHPELASHVSRGIQVQRLFQYANFPLTCTAAQIREYRCLHVNFQSREDYRVGHDILRCTNQWYGRGPRHDCVIIERDDNEPLAFARLQHLFRCTLEGDRSLVADIAVVSHFTRPQRHFRPRTAVEGWTVVEEQSSLAFMHLSAVVRGALLCPVFGTQRTGLFYPVDTIDSDMFLRLNHL